MDFYRLLKNNLLLIFILTLGLFLYCYQLGTIPSGVFMDEALVGYDAFSILNTLKDHQGQTLPIYFKFFNSYTPGLFVYVETIFVKLFGLNPQAIRLPSAISLLSVATGLYWFLKKYKILKLKQAELLALFLFIITPWAVFNARLGYEVTFAFALLSLGILFYEKPMLSFFLISLSTYAGHTQRYLAPLVLLIIYFIFYFKKHPFKKIFLPLVLAAIIQIPNIIMMFTPAFWIKNTIFTSSFIEQYFSYFSPQNLFNKQDNDPQRSIPGLAIFYSWMFFPWLAGIYELYIKRKVPLYFYLICLIIIIPLPAALANADYSTQRALPLLLPYSIVIAIGVDKILQNLQPSSGVVISLCVIAFSLILLWRSYFILFPRQRATAWNYGYDQIAKLIKNNPQKHFIIDNSRNVPGILILFWLKYPPSLLQQENPARGDYYWKASSTSNTNFANVEVRPIDWKVDSCRHQVLVGDGLAMSSNQISEHFLSESLLIKDNRHQIILQAYDTNPALKCAAQR
ncbi:MAG: hypothetical protein WC841_05920 [Candidatus Shapirobacteria bacterium]